MRKKLFVFVLFAVFVLAAGCDGQSSDAPQTVVETVEVTRVVEIAGPTQVVTREVEVTAVPSPTPTATPDPMSQLVGSLTVAELAELMGQVEAGGTLSQTASITESKNSTTSSVTGIAREAHFAISGIPIDGVLPARWAGVIQPENECTVPMANWLLAEPGVLGADTYAEAQDNLSCVWHGGANVQERLENETGTIECPEGSYCRATGARMTISADTPEGTVVVELEAAPDHYWTFVARSFYAERDLGHLPLEFSGYDAGAVMTHRYPVRPENAGFFSLDYMEDDLENGHSMDNCGVEGCTAAGVILVDYNDKAVAVYSHESGNWELEWTNVVPPTP